MSHSSSKTPATDVPTLPLRRHSVRDDNDTPRALLLYDFKCLLGLVRQDAMGFRCPSKGRYKGTFEFNGGFLDGLRWRHELRGRLEENGRPNRNHDW